MGKTYPHATRRDLSGKMSELASSDQLFQNRFPVNSRPKKAKRAGRIVAYIRMNAKEHAQISKIARKRGHPHTFTSVAAELLSKALKMEV